MFLGDGRALVGSSKVSKSQVDTILVLIAGMGSESSKVSRSQVDTILDNVGDESYESSKVSKSQVDTMDSLKNGIPAGGMPFCYCEESSRACLGMSRLYGISKISIRGSHPASHFCRSLRTFVAVFEPLSQSSHLCRSRHAPADTMRSTTRARFCVSSKSARFQVETIDIHDTTSMSKSSKVSKSKVDTIAIVTELIHYQSSKVSKSQVDTIERLIVLRHHESSKVSRSQIDTIANPIG